MRMMKSDARCRVLLDLKNKKIAIVVKEESGEESKVLFGADVAYSIGHTLEAYALMLKQSEKAVSDKAKAVGVDAEALAEWVEATEYDTGHDEEIMWWYERRNWKAKRASGGMFPLDYKFVKALEKERQDARKNAEPYQLGELR